MFTLDKEWINIEFYCRAATYRGTHFEFSLCEYIYPNNKDNN